jgi:membrane-associated phospholipid phosphatase
LSAEILVVAVHPSASLRPVTSQAQSLSLRIGSSRRAYFLIAGVLSILLLRALVPAYACGQDDPPLLDPASLPDPSSTDLTEIIVPPPPQRDVSLTQLPRNFLNDQGKLWAFPLKLGKGQYLAPSIFVGAATAALFYTDSTSGSYFRHAPAFRGFNHVFGSGVTGKETIFVPTALYAFGLARRDSYMQKTALFAAEAVADSEVLRSVLNTATRRWRPEDVRGLRTYGDTFFHSRSRVGSSFPSGHEIAAVAVATVIARRYGKHRWVPWAAYGLAGAIGFSRLTLREHFPSDVFFGGALGYAVARYDVVRE